MTKEINKKLNYFIKFKTYKRIGVQRSKNQEKVEKRPRTAPLAHLSLFTMNKDNIYKLILEFQRCQVGQVRSIIL